MRTFLSKILAIILLASSVGLLPVYAADGFGIENIAPLFSLIFPCGFLGIIGLIILLVVADSRARKRRQEEMQKLAVQNSWTYYQSTNLPFLKEFDLYINNSSWSGSNALTGSSNNVLMGVMNGRNFFVSDQIYTTGSGKNRTTHRKTMVGIELREANLPFMCLYPEGFFDRVFDGWAKYDIDFPNHPVFSQKYVLYGANENHIRTFFDHRIAAFYEQQPPFNTACGGKYLVIWGDILLKPEQILIQLNFLSSMADLFLKKY